MSQDVVDINHFYATPVGQMTSSVIQGHISSRWPDVRKKKVLAIGFGLPYLKTLQEQNAEVYAAMPSSLGVVYWPEGERNRSALCHEKALPFADQAFDCVLLSHAIEYANNLDGMMKEAWRVLKGSGRILIISPNRGSIWSKSENTPFAHGRPFSSRQMMNLLRNHRFLFEGIDKALFFMPWDFCFEARSAAWLERWGKYVLLSGGGILVTSATKQLYAVNPKKGTPVSWRVPVMKPGSVSPGG